MPAAAILLWISVKPSGYALKVEQFGRRSQGAQRGWKILAAMTRTLGAN